MRDDESERHEGDPGPLDLPDEVDTPDQVNDEELDRQGPSLTDDILALVEDGKTYAEAELAFQKSRASFAANRIKVAIALGAGAFGVLHLALIALSVGAVIALAPLVGAWLATAIVAFILIAAGVIMLLALKSKIDDIRNAFSEDTDGGPTDD